MTDSIIFTDKALEVSQVQDLAAAGEMSSTSVSSTPANASTPAPELVQSTKIPVTIGSGSAYTAGGGANYRPLPPRNKPSDLASTTGKCKHTSKQKVPRPICYFEGSSEEDEDAGSQSGDGSSSGDTTTSNAPTKHQRISRIMTRSLARTPVSNIVVEGDSSPPSPAPSLPIPAPIATATAIATPIASPPTNPTTVIAPTDPTNTQSTGTPPDTMDDEPSPSDTPHNEDPSHTKVAVFGTRDTEVTGTEDVVITGTDAVVQVHPLTASLPVAVLTTSSSPVWSTVIDERDVPAFLLSHGKGTHRVDIFAYLNKIQDPRFRQLFFHYIQFEMNNQSNASRTLPTMD